MPDQVDWRAIEREAGPGQAVGRLLRDQREARGLDLTQVEKSIRIRRAHLEAIEEGRYDKLPGAAYIPAFLRAYAAHVGLDPEKVMTAYHLSGEVRHDWEHGIVPGDTLRFSITFRTLSDRGLAAAALL